MEGGESSNMGAAEDQLLRLHSTFFDREEKGDSFILHRPPMWYDQITTRVTKRKLDTLSDFLAKVWFLLFTAQAS